MKTKKVKEVDDASTEEKIKNAARTVFHKKGFAGTRTRDIAEEAGINLALLNYYFRSKEKLFDIIVLETMQSFFNSMADAFNNDQTSLESKVETLVSNYIDLLTKNPDIPLFILSELKMNPTEIVKKIGVKDLVMNSYFMKQYIEEANAGKIAMLHPMHFIMNMMGMIVFPFIASPILKSLGDLPQDDFNDMMQQRKKMIPLWIKAILNTNPNQ